VGTSPKDSSPLTLITGDQAYEVEVEIEIDEGAIGGLMVFYSEKLFAGMAFSADRMIEFWKGGSNSFDKQIPMGNRFFLKLRNDHHYVSVYYSADGKNWRRHWMNFETPAYHHNVADGFLCLRPALLAAGEGEVKFRNFKYKAQP